MSGRGCWIQDLDPGNPIVMGNRAVAHARLGDFRGADYWLVQMRSRASDSRDPYLNVLEGMVSAIRGEESLALAQLEEAVALRGALPEGLQLELRRDIAIDPSFGSLRTDEGLHRMLWRHYGADHPRKLSR